jgi:hypothetical protein
MRNKTSIKSSLSKIVKKAYKESDEEFKRDIEDVSANKFRKNNYLGYPTLEREIHTLFSRFEEGAEFQLKQELLEFITNRKNLIVQNEDNILKIPDNTVYSQGIKLYQEEIDEIDNRHRIQLSCREINTTPEKILLDLLRTEGVSIVLCSATASSMSVINNFDIKYLRDRVGEGFSVLEMIEAARKVTGHSIPANIAERRAGDPVVLIANSDKARKVLGWVPTRENIEVMIKDAWCWEQNKRY